MRGTAITVVVMLMTVLLSMVSACGYMHGWKTVSSLIVNGSVVINDTRLHVTGDVICISNVATLEIVNSLIHVDGRVMCRTLSGTAYPTAIINATGVEIGNASNLHTVDGKVVKIESSNLSGRYVVVATILFTDIPYPSNATVYIYGRAEGENISGGIYLISPQNRTPILVAHLGTRWSMLKIEVGEKYISPIYAAALPSRAPPPAPPQNVGALVLLINMSSTSPFNVTLDMVKARYNATIRLDMVVNRSRIVVERGGEIENLTLYATHSSIISREPIYVSNGIVISEDSHISGIYIKNLAAILTSGRGHVDVTCRRCGYVNPLYSVLINTTNVEVRNMFMHCIKALKIIIHVLNMSRRVRIVINTTWCRDNETVIVLPNHTVMNIHSCHIELTFRPESRNITVVVYHGVYVRHVIFSVAPAQLNVPVLQMIIGKFLNITNNITIPTILNVTVRPNVRTLFRLVVNASHGTRSIIAVINVSRPARIFVNGSDITDIYVRNVTMCNTSACWTYNESSRELILEVYHGSPVTVTAYSARIRMNVTAVDGVVRVDIYYPYDYTENLMVCAYMYSLGRLVEKKCRVITPPPDSIYSLNITLPRQHIDKVVVYLYDQYGCEVSEKSISVGTFSMFPVVWLVVGLTVFIIVLVLAIRGRACMSSRRSMFRF